MFLFFVSGPPPRYTRTYTLFPHTTRFRSVVDRLAQREEPAEEIGCDIAGRGQPLRCAGNQPFDRIADPQQRAAGKREDQLGIGAEKFGVAMVVTIAGA